MTENTPSAPQRDVDIKASKRLCLDDEDDADPR
jgi:hypothetical protein